ncbi:MAG: isoprenylcysteine carboxylmethyltransferase family protein [Acidimicrobiales bacterium]
MVKAADDLIQVAWAVIVVVWVVMAFRTKRTVARSGGVARLAVVYVVAVIVLTRPLEHTSLHHHIWMPSSAVSVVAVILVVAGAIFALWARLTIGRNWSGVVTLKLDHELMQSGPYRFARHPIYTGLLTMGLGSALQYDEPFSFILLAVVIVMLVFKIRLEEKLMTESFPDEYPQYRRRVKAVVPYIL